VATTAAVIASSCSGEGSGSSQTTLGLTSTNYVTVATTPTTIATTTSLGGTPGAVHPEEGSYTLTADDLYAANVAAKFKVKLEDLLAINNLALDANNFVPGWPGPGGVIRIPPNWTEPGAAPDTSGSTGGTSPPTNTTTTVAGGQPACSGGEYTIVEGDYEGKVATKLDTTVEALRAVNVNTPGYSSFYPGLVIKTPSKTGC
jgi:LysM repeat protein